MSIRFAFLHLEGARGATLPVHADWPKPTAAESSGFSLPAHVAARRQEPPRRESFSATATAMARFRTPSFS
jgi:hypothetical protein